MTSENQQRPLSQWQLAPFYVGAAVGPTSTGVLAVVFTILTQAFHVDRAVLSLALPAYMVPYAAVQLISGGVSDLTSRRSSVLLGFAAYGAATLVSGLAPNVGVFLLGQALQGTANAFTTPILMATLGDIVPRRRVGRTMGMFSSANLAGTMVGPLVAGVVAPWSWRAAYVVFALATWALTGWYVVWFRRFGHAVPIRIRTAPLRAQVGQMLRAMGPPVLLLASLSFLANGATRGQVYLLAAYLHDTFGTAVGSAGLILAAYGLAGLLAGPLAGLVVERAGVYRGIAAASVVVALALAAMALAPSPWTFAGAYFVLGAATIVDWAALNTLAIGASAAHRGAVTSIFGSAKFLAQAIAPLWFTPLYQELAPWAIFPVAAAMALAILLPLAGLRLTAARAERAATREPVLR